MVTALAGKKNVIVLERTDEPMAGDNPMGRDIRTALNKALRIDGNPVPEGLPAITASQMPRLFSGIYGLGSRDFRPEHILGAYEFATGSLNRQDGKRAADGTSFFVLGVDHPYAVKSDETPSLLPEGAVAVRFHSIGGWGAITTGKNLGAIIGDLNDLLYERDKIVDELGNPKEIIHVSANPKYGSEKKGAPTAYFMVAAPERIRVNCDLRHVNVVLCCDPKAFTHTNPLDGMSEGGCLVWESEEEGEQAWERLPLWARKQIIEQKDPRLHFAGLPDCPQGDGSCRPSTSHAGQRFSGRILRSLAAACGFPHHPGAVPRGRSPAVRQEVWPARRGGCEFEHGSDDAGLRACPRDSRGRTGGSRSFDAARGGAPARHEWWRRRLPHRMPFCSDSCHPARPNAGDSGRDLQCRVPCGLRLQPAIFCLCVGRSHCCRKWRHRVQVCRAPRDAALHRRELHAVHGMHRGLSRHGATQLFGGSGDDTPHRRRALRDGSRRAPEDVAFPARDRASVPAR